MSVFFLSWTFYQVRLARDSQKYTTFITPFGRYCYGRLLFIIMSAPEYFQHQMSRLLEELAVVVNVMDGILLFDRTAEEHDQRSQAVLSCLQQAGVTLVGVTSAGYYDRACAALRLPLA